MIGLEPMTSAVSEQRSNRLNYISILFYLMGAEDGLEPSHLGNEPNNLPLIYSALLF